MTDEPVPLLDHLQELSSRLWTCLICCLAFALLGYMLVDHIIGALAKSAGGFVFTHPTEAFFARVKIAMMTGVFFSLPIIIQQVWSFVAKALTLPERKVLRMVLPVSYILFCMGAAVAWYIVIPAAMRFFLGFTSLELKPMISINAYVGFVAYMLLAFGVVFELPLALIFLAQLGIVNAAGLAARRRMVILLLAIVAAVFTPGPDIVSQLALLIPSYLLFELSVIIIRVRERKVARTACIDNVP